MIKVELLEAQASFDSLIDRVEKGEDVLIIRNGSPVARMVGAAGPDRAKYEAAWKKLFELRQGNRLNGLSWKALRDEGRKY